MNLISRDDAFNSMNPRPLRTALRIALGYAVVGWVWILTSDRIVAVLTQDPATLVILNSLKAVFVKIVVA